jgi:hypothetical protein
MKRLLCLLIVFASVIAWADDDDGIVSINKNTNTNTLTGGDVSVAGGDTNVTGGDVNVAGDKSTALGFSHALGDVDIRDCVASTQWGTIVVSRQKIVLNSWCAGVQNLAWKNYRLAAMHFCNVPETLAEFASEDECEAAHDYSPPPEPEPPPGMVSLEQYEQQAHEHEEQYSQLLERVATIEQKPAPRPRVVQAAAPPPEPFLTERKKAALRELYDDEDEPQ